RFAGEVERVARSAPRSALAATVPDAVLRRAVFRCLDERADAASSALSEALDRSGGTALVLDALGELPPFPTLRLASTTAR
ncbi:MAG: hypothetical protein KC621_10550, partial [Myxococcales bacterium]|nr:hypothetical protein [Myxococcales bacterium]